MAKIMGADKTLEELFDALVERQFIPQSRLAPIRTALKQYAIILGYKEPAECPMTAYHLPAEKETALLRSEQKVVGNTRPSVFTPFVI